MLTNAPMRVVSVFDENIDYSRIDRATLIEYRDSRVAAKLPPAKPGAKLTVYTLRPLSRYLAIHYVHAQPEHTRDMYSFQLGLERVEHLVQIDGTVSPLWMPTTQLQSPTGPITIVNERELELFNLAVIQEIGALVYQLAFLGRTSGAWWRLPHSYRDEWDAQVVRHADNLAPTSALPSNEPREEVSQISSASPGGEPTDANATENHTAP